MPTTRMPCAPRHRPWSRWLSQFQASGDFASVECQIAGLGEIEDIQQRYIEHTKAAIDSLNG